MHCCIKEPSAYPLTQDTISNPKRFSVFSVLFQHRIPKCIRLILILWFEQTKVREYFSVLLRSKVVFVRFSESDSFRFQLSESEFHTAIPHYSYLSLELSIPCFLPDSQNFMSRPWSSMKPGLTKERSDWQTSIFFLRLLFFTLTSPLLVTLLLFVLLFFLLLLLLLSFSICFSSSHWTKSFVFTLYSVLSLVLTLAQSFMFPFLHLSLALALSITDNLPRVASIHFSARKLSTPFLTQNPKGGKLKKESRRREN